MATSNSRKFRGRDIWRSYARLLDQSPLVSREFFAAPSFTPIGAAFRGLVLASRSLWAARRTPIGFGPNCSRANRRSWHRFVGGRSSKIPIPSNGAWGWGRPPRTTPQISGKAGLASPWLGPPLTENLARCARLGVARAAALIGLHRSGTMT